MLSVLVIPASVAEELEQLMRNFLWGSTAVKKKFHLLSWESMCLPLGWGGLDINILRDINISLLCKWLWNPGNGEKTLWKIIIFEQYGKEIGGWMTKPYHKPHGYEIWKGIQMQCEFFYKHIAFRLGNGERIRFWEDTWCEAGSLMLRFPSIFEASRSKNFLLRIWQVQSSVRPYVGILASTDASWILNFWFCRSSLTTLREFVCKLISMIVCFGVVRTNFW